jgi:hypothetical protein
MFYRAAAFVVALVLGAAGLWSTATAEVGSCGTECSGPCTGFLIRNGTCQSSNGQCVCISNTPGPGECGLACDGRPCVDTCPDGTMASGVCTYRTIDTGCRCTLPCGTPTATAISIPTLTPTPSECGASCDSRPCMGRCPNGIIASGLCAAVTIDRGCACVPSCPFPLCPGDCSGNGKVTPDELVQGVDIALGITALDQCPAMDADQDGSVTIDDLLRAVETAIAGVCPG